MPLLAMVILFFAVSGPALRDQAMQNRSGIAEQVAHQIESVLENAVLDLENMKTNPRLVTADTNNEERQKELDRLRGNRFLGLALCDANGFIIGSSSEREVSREYSPWFEVCRDENRIVVSHPLRMDRGEADELFVAVYMPVPEQNENTVSVIRAQLSFDRVWKILDNGSGDRQGQGQGTSRLYLVDSHQNIIYSGERSEIYRKFDQVYPEVDLSFMVGEWKQRDQSWMYVNQRVEPRYELEASRDWNLVWMEDKRTSLAVLDRTYHGLFLSLLVGAGVALIIGVTVSKRITGPIQDAAEAARVAGEGNLTVRLPRMEYWELDVMGRSLNTMLEKVGKQTSELEGQVHARNRELEKTNDELRGTVAQLRQAQKMEGVGVLAGGIAHDFNNLLTVIVGNVVLAQKRASGGLSRKLEMLSPDQPCAAEWISAQQEDLNELRACLRTAQTAGEQAAGVVRQLLGFSRNSERCAKVHDLNTLVDEIRDILARTVDRRLEIITERAEKPCFMEGDSNQIQQVLMNLCVNAKDALESRGRIVLRANHETVGSDSRIRNGVIPIPGEYVVISVSDNGPGIPEHVLKNIFQPFFTTKAPNKGTGLGLAMCSGIAREHGGWIECETQVGQGTEFKIYLPKASTAAVERYQKETEEEEDTVECEPMSATVLLADDEPAVRLIAETVLSRQGFSVVTANDGSEAVDLVMREPDRFDVVILDGAMPVMSGQEAFMVLDREQPHLPVIICSGNFGDGKEFQTDCGRLPDAFITKPYAFDKLTQQVASVVSKCRAA